MLYGQLQVLWTLLISELRRHKLFNKMNARSLSAIFRDDTIRLLNEYQIHFLLHVYGERKMAVLKKLHTVKYSELQSHISLLKT